MMMYKNYLSFKILGQDINLISEKLSHGYNTVIEVDDKFHYMGDEYPSLSTAILAWQEINGRDLTNEELHHVLLENQLTSQAI